MTANNRQTVPSTITSNTAIILKQDHGISKSQLRFITETNWVIPDAYRDLYSTYYLKYWHNDYLRAAIIQGTITDTNSGIKYQVVYHRCTPEKVFDALPSQVALSFRVPHGFTGLLPTVLISLTKHLG